MPGVKQTNENPTKQKRKCFGCCCCYPKRKKSEKQSFLLNEIDHKNDGPAYSEEIVQSLTPGCCIIIKGKIRSECKRFAINFLSVRGAKTDVVFHFNPRLALRYIVRNARINNSWGDEETTSVEKFHIQRNETFELQFVTAEREFLVALDGRHVCAFVYRIPLERINKIEVVGIIVEAVDVIRNLKSYPSVDGAIDVEGVEHKQVSNYPPGPTSFTVPLGGGDAAQRIGDQELIVPVTATLPKGFQVGWQLEISGRIKILPAAFYVNLQVGDKLWPHPVIPLHLNPRFYTSYGNHLFVRNSWENGSWGAEERTAGFQFTPGRKFHLAIRKHPDHFAVWVDGTLTGEFLFRTEVDDIDTVYIHGDIHVFNIYMRDHVEDKYFTKSKERIDSL
ncbi:galectin-4-like isoform X3 [Sitophilus oryzae]|uniref:Galectin n=1 Tax=Sitophilus oryzae TaxID=7048 RepID=A0A6J2X437_SITOR|nr:galectin-4-like isoform X3 [Sitophilus oryzae]